MKKTLTAIGLCLALAACGTAPKNVVASVAEAEAAVFRLAVEYVNLPECAPPAVVKPFCNTDEEVQNIKKAKDVAYIAALEAKSAVMNPMFDGDAVDKAVAAATHALAALRAAIPSLSGGN